MKRLFVLFLMALIGIGVIFSNAKADEARTIPYKYGVAKDANKVIVAHGGTLYMVTGDAEDASCGYSIHDSSSAGAHTSDTDWATTENTMAEGGEASDEDSLTTLDFRPEGLPFTYGLTIMTTTCNVSVVYR